MAEELVPFSNTIISKLVLDEWSRVANIKHDYIFHDNYNISHGLPSAILNSWKDAKANNLLPTDKLPRLSYSEKQLTADDIDSSIFTAIQSMFNKMDIALAGQTIIIVNAKGKVIFIVGNDNHMHDLEKINVCVGANLSFEAVGTTAHHLSMVNNAPTQLIGPYHYLDIFNNQLAVALPIHVHGKLIGSLTLLQHYIDDAAIPSATKKFNFITSLLTSLQNMLDIEKIELTSSLIKATIKLNMQDSAKNIGIISINSKNNIAYICEHAKSTISYTNSTNLQEYIPNIDRLIKSSYSKPKNKLANRHKLSLPNGNTIQISINHLRDDADKHVIGYALFVSEDKTSSSVRYSLDNMIGNHISLNNLKEKVYNISDSNHNVLIIGGSGTGKELVAQAIHDASGLTGPFVAINCASIPSNLIESELFGYVEGAFTGAVKAGSMGKIEYANNGTLFLDEIGDMPLALQPVLLRVLEERQITRIGSKEPIPINVRIIAATNVNLYDKVTKNEFRDDLYFRLAVINIKIPLLKDRGSDVLLLAEHFIERENRTKGTNIEMSEEVENILLNYEWPGNIRQLENSIISAIYSLNNERIIMAEHLPEIITASSYGQAPQLLETHTHDIIVSALQRHNWHVSNTAKSLGISRATLYNKMKKMDIRY